MYYGCISVDTRIIVYYACIVVYYFVYLKTYMIRLVVYYFVYLKTYMIRL